MTTKGKFFHSLAQNDLQVTRPLYAFVPEDLLKEGGIDRTEYVRKRWAAINAGANENAIGSHVFPDLARPASEEETRGFRKALAKHIHKSAGAASAIRKPGAAGRDEMQM